MKNLNKLLRAINDLPKPMSAATARHTLELLEDTARSNGVAMHRMGRYQLVITKDIKYLWNDRPVSKAIALDAIRTHGANHGR